MKDFLTIYLSLYFVLFFGLAFLWRTWNVWKLTGINAFKLKAKVGPESITGIYFRLIPILTIGVMFVYFLLPNYYTYLAPFYWLSIPAVQLTGISIMTFSLVWVFLAQGHMGKSWRIGIDHDSSSDFVQNGLFKYSRNPIFFGIMLSTVGYFMVLPNALTLLVIILELALIQVQISLEEQFLRERFGDSYMQYSNRVRRWI